jgi:hypothetical protein
MGRHYAPRFARFPVRGKSKLGNWKGNPPDLSGFNEAVLSGQGRVSDRHRQAFADLVHLRRNTGPEIAITPWCMQLAGVCS